VAPEQAVDRLNYESWKHSHLTLPVARTLGCFAGGLEEVGENAEYEERKDEFENVLAERKMRR